MGARPHPAPAHETRASRLGHHPPASPPHHGKGVQASGAEPEGGLTTGEEYRLLAGGADEATGVGSALGYAA